MKKISAAPPWVELAGLSMEPTLRVGWRVRVAPLDGEPDPGDVVLLRCASGLLVHRVLAVEFWGRGRRRLFHRGDGPGRAGIVFTSAVVGKVTAILSPGEGPLPGWADLPAVVRRRFKRSRRRCLFLARLVRLAAVLRLDRSWPPLKAGLRRLLS